MQRLFPLVFCWLICSRKQTIDYVIAQTLVPSVKFLQSRTFNAFKDFGRCTHKISLPSQCSNRSTASSKVTSSVGPKRVHPFSLRMHRKSTQRKLASHKKTSRGKVSRRNLVTITKKNNLEAKKKRSVVRKKITTNSSRYASRH